MASARYAESGSADPVNQGQNAWMDVQNGFSTNSGHEGDAASAAENAGGINSYPQPVDGYIGSHNAGTGLQHQQTHSDRSQAQAYHQGQAWQIQQAPDTLTDAGHFQQQKQQERQQSRWAYATEAFQAQLRQYQAGAMSGAADTQSQSPRPLVNSQFATASTPQPGQQQLQQQQPQQQAYKSGSMPHAGSVQEQTAYQPQQQKAQYTFQCEPLRLGGNSPSTGSTWQDQQRPQKDVQFTVSGMEHTYTHAHATNTQYGHGQSVLAKPLEQAPSMQQQHHMQAPTPSYQQAYSTDVTDSWKSKELGNSLFADLQGRSPANSFMSAEGSCKKEPQTNDQAQYQLSDGQQPTYDAYMAAIDTQGNQGFDAPTYGHAFQPSYSHQIASESRPEPQSYPPHSFGAQPQSFSNDQLTSHQASSYPGTMGSYLDSDHFSFPSHPYPSLHYNYNKPSASKTEASQASSSSYTKNYTTPTSGDTSSGGLLAPGQKRDRPSKQPSQASSSSRASSRRSSGGDVLSIAQGPLSDGPRADTAHPGVGQQSAHPGNKTIADERTVSRQHAAASPVQGEHRGTARPIAGRRGNHDRVPSLSRLQLDQTNEQESSQSDNEMPGSASSTASAPPFYATTVFPPPGSQESESTTNAQPSQSPRQARRQSKTQDDYAAPPETASSASDLPLGSIPGTRRMYECKTCGRSELSFSSVTIDIEADVARISTTFGTYCARTHPFGREAV